MFYFNKRFLISLLLLTLSLSANADDIDIINKEPYAPDTNILFVLDVSNSMKWDTSGIDMQMPVAPAKSRIDVLKEALDSILADNGIKKINIGLSSFSGEYTGVAHGISYPVSSGEALAQNILDQNPLFTHSGNGTFPGFLFNPIRTSFLPTPRAGKETREYLSSIASTFSPRARTPIVSALYEAALYFRGDFVYWGKSDPLSQTSAHPSTYTGSLATIAPAGCVAAARRSCSFASCNIVTRNCVLPTPRHRASSLVNIPGKNCTPNINNKRLCAIGAASCSLGTNCVPKGDNISCSSASSGCHLPRLGPNLGDWYNCTETGPHSRSVELGGDYWLSACKRRRMECDAPSNYTCDTNQKDCTHCPSVLTGTPKYNSPIVDKCAANGIVLLSDGAPSINRRSTKVRNLISTGVIYNTHNNCDTGSADEGRCGPELAKFLASEDNNPSPLVPGNQTVRTFTIGLALSSDSNAADYLKALAASGDGAYVNASSASALAAAFKAAILGIADKKARSFSSPSYSVDNSTRLSNGDVVYVPVFDRGGGGIWSGNLKKYELMDGELYGFNTGGMKVKATDATGNLKGDIKDLWATAISTHAVKSGGAANKISAPVTRKVYTDAGVGAYPTTLSAHKLDVSNASVTATLLGDASISAAYRAKIINYVRGKNTDGSTRHHMGDTIHSIPAQLTYKLAGVDKTAVFIGTNEGFLHGFDGDSGSELFAFMPKELLKNVKDQYESIFNIHHTYGVDGSMTLWIDETGAGANKNGILDPATEKAYLFFGLRRGGKAYYALDVTDPSSPKLLWKKDSSNLSGLGFSWSKPTIAKLKYKQAGVIKTDQVLVFGGGYVNDHATPPEAVNSGTGANVYIINAKTGARIFDVNTDVATTVPAGSLLTHAIPADIRVLDVDRNGSIDRLYFGDTGGNLWRVDLNADTNNPYDQTKAQLTKLASLGGAGANNRMFFTEPDTALFKTGGDYVLSLSIGTGSRPDPLGMAVDNYFFTLFDENIYKAPPAGFASITLLDFINAPTNVNLIGHASKKGWKVNLNPMPANPSLSVTGLSGEKVLSKPITFQNMVLFTSFGVDSLVPNVVNAVTCSVENRNKTRLYALDVLTGKAGLDLTGDSTISDTADSSIEITGGEIVATPKIVFNDFQASGGGACTKDDCIRPFEIHAGRGPALANQETRALNPVSATKNLPRVYWIDQEK